MDMLQENNHELLKKLQVTIYLKLTGRTFTIWLLTAFINGLLAGIAISIYYREYDMVPESCIIACILSLVFSVPGFFIFWLVLLFRAARHDRERELFRAALSAGFILSAATAACAYGLLFSEVKNYAFVLILVTILSSLISIMMHFKHFKNLK
jgi:hypothetical protein